MSRQHWGKFQIGEDPGTTLFLDTEAFAGTDPDSFKSFQLLSAAIRKRNRRIRCVD